MPELVPRPDVAYVIDADPSVAIARKPEYPLEFLHRNRQAYLNMAKLADNITVIEPGSVETMQASIRQKMLQALPALDRRPPYAGNAKNVQEISY